MAVLEDVQTLGGKYFPNGDALAEPGKSINICLEERR